MEWQKPVLGGRAGLLLGAISKVGEKIVKAS